MMDALLASIRPRALLLGMASLVLLLAVGLCANLLMPGYKAFRKADRDRAELARVVGSGEALGEQIAAEGLVEARERAREVMAEGKPINRAAAVVTDQLRRPPTARLATYRRALAIVRRDDVIEAHIGDEVVELFRIGGGE